MNKLDERLTNLEEQMDQTRKLKKLEKIRKTDHKVQKIEKDLTEIKEWNVELESSILKQEMERVAMLIRIQNFPECQQENTHEMVATWLTMEMKIAE